MARILVIDDDQSFRALVLDLLRSTGHTADEAADGFEALQKLRAAPADLVLTDMMMPYGGLATIRLVHAEFPHLGVIAMTGAGTHRLDYARSLGAHQTLTKPFTAEQLTAAIAAVLATRPPAPPPSAQ